MSSSRTGRSVGPRCRPAPRPAPTRRSSCATATRRATAARACCKAVANVTETIAPALYGLDAADQAGCGRPSSTSTARPTRATSARTPSSASRWPCAHAAAAAYDLPLYRYLGGVGARTLPVPMFNILNGGKHAQDSTDFQEFMVMPVGAETFGDALRAGAEIFHALKAILHDEGHATGQGDEGGFAPSLASNEAAVEVILRAIERAGYRPGEDVAIALDPATTELVEEGSGGDGALTRYVLAKEGRTLDSGELVDLWADWGARYPIVSIEDGLAEDDWAGWRSSPAGSAIGSSSSATTCSSRTPSGSPARSRRARRTRCSSSSTRSAR